MCHQLSTTQNKGEENKLHQVCCQWYHIIVSLSWLLCKYTTQLRFVSMILDRCVRTTPSPIQTPILIDIHRLAVGLGIGVGECERAISENINNLLMYILWILTPLVNHESNSSFRVDKKISNEGHNTFFF